MAKSNAPRLEISIDAITTGLKKGLEEARKELKTFNDQVKGASGADFKNALNAEKLALATLKTEAQQARTEIAQLALAKNKAKSETTALSGSYREAQQRLTALGKAIREAEGGFTNTTPAIRAQISEYNKLNGKLKEFDAQMGNHHRNVGNYRDALGGMVPAIGQFASLAGVGVTASRIFSDAGRTIAQFDSGLKNVEKTTGLSRKEISDLGDDFIKMSRQLEVVSPQKLTEYATVAGQLGVKGSENISRFTETLAKLETASNISGEQGGAEIARMLQLVDGGVQNIKKFGDEIVNLGNNFPATEKEILSNAEAIAQNVGIYKIGRQEILAFATATKSVGIEAELVGSTFNRTLAVFENAIRTGNGLSSILNLIGGNQASLSKRFKEDASGVFVDFVGALNKVYKSGGSVNEQLENLGINAVRDQRVIQSLAANGYDVLTSSLNTVRSASGSLDKEFTTQSEKLVNQTGKIGVAWDNLILSIEKGDGALGKTTASMSSYFAKVLGSVTNLVTSDSWTSWLNVVTGALNPQSFLGTAMGGAFFNQKPKERSNQTSSQFMESLNNGGYDFYGRTTEKAKENTTAIQDNSEAVTRNKQYWKEQVDTIKASIEALDLSKKGTKEWIDLNNKLSVAQKNLDFYDPKKNKVKGKTQAELIKEANEALGAGQIRALEGIDGEMAKIDAKWDSINSKINKITDSALKKQKLGLSSIGRETEKYNKFLELFAKSSPLTESRGDLPRTTSGVLNTPSSLPNLAWNQWGINNRRRSPKFSDDELEDEFSTQFKRTLGRGLSSIFNDLFSDITSMSQENYSIEKKYANLRKEATQSQIEGLNRMEALERKINNGLTNMISKIGGTFVGIGGNMLSSALSTGISSGNFSDLTGMFKKGNKAVGYGALGSLAGGLIQGVSSPTSSGGQIFGGLLAGAGTGAAVGSLIGPVGTIVGTAVGAIMGAVSGLFSANKAKKQQQLAEEQLNEQKKLVALQERQMALAYASSVIGQKTNQGIVTGVERNEFGDLVSRVRGSDLELVIERSKSSR